MRSHQGGVLLLVFLIWLNGLIPAFQVTSQTQTPAFSASDFPTNNNSPVRELQDNCTRLAQFDENYGDPTDIFIQQRGLLSIAFVAEGSSGVAILDVSNPNNPKFISQISNITVTSLFVSKNIAFFGGGNDGVAIYNIFNLNNPQFLSFYRKPLLKHLYFRDNFLYIYDIFQVLTILDVSNPKEPKEVVYFNQGISGNHFVIRDNYFFVVSSSGFAILDISDFNHIILVSQISFGFSFNSKLTLFGDRGILSAGKGLYLLDLSNLASPTIIDHYNQTNDFVDSFIDSNLLYALTSNEGFILFNASLLDSFVVVGNYSLNFLEYRNLFFFNNKIYVISRLGVSIFSFKGNDSPLLFLGHFYDGGFSSGIFVENSIAYVANGYLGFVILDITNPYRPKKIAQYIPENEDYFSVVVKNHLAFVSKTGGSMDIFDVSNPYSPLKFTTSFPKSIFPFYWSKIIANDFYAFQLTNFVSTGGKWFRIYDISNKQNISLLNEELWVEIFDLQVKGDFLFAVEREIFHIYDAADPLNLISLSNLTISSAFLIDLLVFGNYAFISDCYSGLKIVDISDLLNPILISSYRTIQEGDYSIAYLAYESSYLYMSDLKKGLLIFNVSKIDEPALVGQYYFYNKNTHFFGGNLEEVFIEDNIVCLAAGLDGVLIIHPDFLPMSQAFIHLRNVIIISIVVPICALLIATFIILLTVYYKKKRK